MKKFNIILDLDQTIISAEGQEELKNDKIRKRITKFPQTTRHDMDNLYLVFERPHLQKFLDFLFKNFNVSVWTAASKSYALFIIKHIIMTKPDRQLQYIFYEDHCKISNNQTKKLKNLALLWEKYQIPNMNCDNTFIFDDNDEVFNSQIGNCLRAKPFFFKTLNSENEDFLVQVSKLLQKNLNKNDISFIREMNKKLKN